MSAITRNEAKNKIIPVKIFKKMYKNLPDEKLVAANRRQGITRI